MASFRKILKNFRKEDQKRLTDILQGLIQQGVIPKSIAVSPKSKFSITPGDVFAFKYRRSRLYRLMIIMQVKRGPGMFISTRNNLLVCGFKLNELKDSTGILLNRLYKNRLSSDYYLIKRLYSHLFGLENFRTYKLSDMHVMKEIFF